MLDQINLHTNHACRDTTNTRDTKTQLVRNLPFLFFFPGDIQTVCRRLRILLKYFTIFSVRRKLGTTDQKFIRLLPNTPPLPRLTAGGGCSRCGVATSTETTGREMLEEEELTLLCWEKKDEIVNFGLYCGSAEICSRSGLAPVVVQSFDRTLATRTLLCLSSVKDRWFSSSAQTCVPSTERTEFMEKRKKK